MIVGILPSRINMKKHAMCCMKRYPGGTLEKTGADMSKDWKATKFPGVYSKSHSTRKYGAVPDQCFSILYRLTGKKTREVVGWASEGVTALSASAALAELRKNQRDETGPRTLAEKRLIAEETRIETERQAVLDKAEGITFSEVWAQYFAGQTDKTAKSLDREESLHRIWIAPVLDTKPMKSICPLDIERIKKNMADKGRAPRSLQYMVAVVRQVFNFADDHDLFTGTNPTRKVKVKIGDNRRQRFLSLDEANELLTECKSRSQNIYDICLLSLHTGMRAGECFKLEWGDVDMGTEQLTLRCTKNGTTRHAYMTEAVKAMLKDRRTTTKTEQVFPGRPEISSSFDRAVVACGLNRGITDRAQKIVFHSLRHTFASWLAMNGTPIYTIAKLMGHKTMAMSERYSHLSPGHLQDAIKGLEASLEKKKPAVDIFGG